jgi:hypothetical protein
MFIALHWIEAPKLQAEKKIILVKPLQNAVSGWSADGSSA